METRSIAFECIVDRIHSSICRLHAWQDVLSDHARSGVAPKKRSTRDLRQLSTRTKLVESMLFKHQRLIFIIEMWFTFENVAQSARCVSRGHMKVKVVQLSESHVMSL